MDVNEALKADALRLLKEEKSLNYRLRELFARLIQSLPETSNPVDLVHTLHIMQGNPFFLQECEKVARNMVTSVARGQYRTWREAAAASTNGRAIFLALKNETRADGIIGQTINEIIQANATKIKTVPQYLANSFTSLIQEHQLSGVRPDAIVNELLSQAPHLTQVEAKRIARTEVGKAATALREARARKYHRDFYIWWDCQDSRVRSSHSLMHGVVCRWDDPPNPERLAGEKRDYGAYHPRGIFNCRCDALTVIALEDIKFPAKAHYRGKIHTVGSLKAFKALYGITDNADALEKE